MDIGHIIPHIEALVFASDKPLTPIDITELINNAFGFMDDKINMEQVQTAMDGIIEKYQSEFYPFEMRESGGGWQFLTKKEFHKTVAQLNGEKFLKRLSTAALETLAIIAYKQPLAKSEIESIRGVSCDYSIQKLLEKELIVISGRNEELPGKPLIYNTSRTFMDYFGINNAEDLPKLKEIFSDINVDPTVMNLSGPQSGSTTIPPGELYAPADALPAESPLLVTPEGELVNNEPAPPEGENDNAEHDAENEDAAEDESADRDREVDPGSIPGDNHPTDDDVS